MNNYQAKPEVFTGMIWQATAGQFDELLELGAVEKNSLYANGSVRLKNNSYAIIGDHIIHSNFRGWFTQKPTDASIHFTFPESE